MSGDLISRAALLETLAKRVPYAIDTKEDVAFAQGLDAAYQAALEAPEQDAEIVVRCVDCQSSSKIAGETAGRSRHCWLRHGKEMGDGFSRVNADDYCSEGTRKRKS